MVASRKLVVADAAQMEDVAVRVRIAIEETM